MKKDTPICITGGSGFVGKSLVDFLVQSGWRNITVLDRNKRDGHGSRSVRYIQGNFSDPKTLSRALLAKSILVHLAGTSNQVSSEKDIVRDAEVSIVGTLKMLEIAASKYVSKVVFISSAPAVYGIPKKLPVELDTVPRPVSAYGVMKLASEHYIRHYAERYNFSYCILRSANAYGPGQLATTHGVVSRFADNVLSNKPIEIWGTSDMMRDFIYIDDLVQAIERSFEPRITNAILNVASGRGRTLAEVIKAVEVSSGKRADIRIQPQRAIDVPRLYFSIAETKKQLNWSPKTSFRKGVEQTVSWLQGLRDK